MMFYLTMAQNLRAKHSWTGPSETVSKNKSFLLKLWFHLVQRMIYSYHILVFNASGRQIGTADGQQSIIKSGAYNIQQK